MQRKLRRDHLAVLAAVAAPLLLTVVLVPFRTGFPNTDAALALILVVVAVAASGYRLAGVLAAISAAVWFDFFLTRPYEQFTITRTSDIETTVLILLIGIAVTELAVWGRRQHLAASRRAGYLEGINAAAEAVAAGGSPVRWSTRWRPAHPAAVAALVPLRVRGGRARPARPAAARRPADGRGPDLGRSNERAGRATPSCWWRTTACCRAVTCCVPEPGSRPTLEQRLVAAAFADQVGAALAASRPVTQ